MQEYMMVILCKKIFSILLCVVFLMNCSAGDVPLVSMVDLIANQEKFSGREIFIQGYFVYEKENQALYLHSEHAFNGITESAIWLNFDSAKKIIKKNGALEDFNKSDFLASLEDIKRNYILVGGVYNKKIKSHENSYAGGVFVETIAVK